ncbi:MAG: hypothetical protein ACK5TA_09330, partial [bacterium]
HIPLYAVYLIVGFYAWVTWQACFSILDKELKIGGEEQNTATIIKLWWSVTWPALSMLAFAAWTNVMLRSRSVFAAFTREKGSAMVGDKVLENARTHGRDPRNRRARRRAVARWRPDARVARTAAAPGLRPARPPLPLG